MSIKLVMFDMDGTIVQYKESKMLSSWGALGIAAGVNEEWDQLMNHYLSLPELDQQYNEWFEKNCRCLTDMLVQPILEQILPPPYTPGFLEFCNYLGQQGVKKGMISGGINLVAEHVQKEASLDFILVPEIYVSQGKFTGTGKINVPLMGKGIFVKEKLAEYGLTREQVAFFGDAFNDVPAWKEVDFPFGINARTEEGRLLLKENFQDFHEALKYVREKRLICPP
ncbi:MAG: HAD-IB family phosphatase [Nanoarchaeota archaeon]